MSSPYRTQMPKLVADIMLKVIEEKEGRDVNSRQQNGE